MTCGRSVVFSGYFGFLHQWRPRYSWNIVERGVKQHMTLILNLIFCPIILIFSLKQYIFLWLNILSYIYNKHFVLSFYFLLSVKFDFPDNHSFLITDLAVTAVFEIPGRPIVNDDQKRIRTTWICNKVFRVTTWNFLLPRCWNLFFSSFVSRFS